MGGRGQLHRSPLLPDLLATQHLPSELFSDLAFDLIKVAIDCVVNLLLLDFGKIATGVIVLMTTGNLFERGKGK